MHVVVGSGSIGTAIASSLAESGVAVRIVTRSGGGPKHPLITRVAADASDTAAFRRAAAGAEVIYNCVNPPYHAWPTDWPPIASALLAAAIENDAVLAITGNLYGYGPVDRPMTEDMPLAARTVKGRVRARMWEEALAAPVRTFEVRASDYIGPRYTVIEMALPALRAGKTAWLPASVDVPHTYTYTGDVARTMIALAGDRRAWGSAWHVPSPPPMTGRELLTRVAEIGGMPAPRLRTYPRAAVRAAALFDKFTKEFLEVRYQHDRPFVLDSSRVSAVFGLTATPVDEAIRAVLRLSEVAVEVHQ
ncbi:NAD-dependent epimerase/dehydratase family protein [Dactylosporangium fulvum]|uniref:NAD-dependent epimerase n=1 Tax=Dactylosporangium fulvum TaxID=53359 RepID=A0ABY5W3M9_9ACTN|nr:NAD-dependent epimerase [Dactylosporangium fulvum]UWP83701.1 NAD-dependent epimerase [Dactylosporangium fulvum]